MKQVFDFIVRVLCHIYSIYLKFIQAEPANGVRYPLVGGTRQRLFAGTSFKPRKLLENAQTPTSRVHAVLGGVLTKHSTDLWAIDTPQTVSILLHEFYCLLDHCSSQILLRFMDKQLIILNLLLHIGLGFLL
jgi:hypothetical protein